MSPTISYASSGAILAVDDAPVLRRQAVATLQSAGYSVFSAESGETALRLFHKHSSEITLVLTEVVLPGMSGPMLADYVLETQPHVKVLFMSGHEASHVVQRFVVERGFKLLAKPFSRDTLMAAVANNIGPARRTAHG